LVIRALSLRIDLVAVAQLSRLFSCSSSSKYHIGRTPTLWLAFPSLIGSPSRHRGSGEARPRLVKPPSRDRPFRNR
jgi:hypothetical protein